MNNKIYHKGALCIPLSQIKVLREIKAANRKRKGLVSCGKSFNELMNELLEQ
jgi:hypothetical protein